MKWIQEDVGMTYRYGRAFAEEVFNPCEKCSLLW